VVVLGAGGAARGAVLALVEAGASRIALVNRTAERARAIAQLDPGISVHAWPEAARLLEGAGAVINTTSLGMEGQPPLELALDALPRAAVVMDMVYRPLRTSLLASAEARGNPTADGLAMLVGQAVPSFEAMFGRPPPAMDVRALCEAALAGRP
jgi:shikimate dehydrogenase